jgi:uncharacterized phage protein (TIGR01671 family)
MREIEFRGKRLDNGEWVHGGYCKHNKVSLCPIGITKEDISKNEVDLIIQDGFSDWGLPIPMNAYEVFGETIGQYTGLKDKNGKEIYEGDILKQNGNDKDLVQICFGKFKVRDIETEEVIDTACGWYMKAITTDELSKIVPFCYDMSLNDSWIESLKAVVIGNIYENSELLRSEI